MSGWRLSRDSQTFSPRQHREMLTLLDTGACHQTIATSLSARDPQLAQTFSLDQSELCAGEGSGQVSLVGAAQALQGLCSTAVYCSLCTVRMSARLTAEPLWSAKPSLAAGRWWEC